MSNTTVTRGLKIGYARVSTDDQDLTAQRDALTALGVDPDRVYVDHGLTGTNRDRPGLREARPPAALATRSSSPSSTGSRGHSRMLGTSSPSSPRATSR